MDNNHQHPCVCTRCTIEKIIVETNDEYPLNRDKILTYLYSETDGEKQGKDLIRYNKVRNNEIDDDEDMLEKKAKKIITLIEQGIDKDDLLFELEILEITLDSTQKRFTSEEFRKNKGKIIH